MAAIERIFTERARAVRARRAPAKLTRISVPEYAIDGIRKEVSNGGFDELCGKFYTVLEDRERNLTRLMAIFTANSPELFSGSLSA